MSTQNVMNLTEQLDKLIKSENGSGVSNRIIELRPKTTQITAGVLSGTIRYEYTTGAQEYVDITKLRHVLNYYRFIDNPALLVRDDNLIDCLFNRASLYLNGKLVSSCNNFTEDTLIVKRLARGAGRNKAIGEIEFYASDVVASAAESTGNLQSISTLDGLFMCQGESIYIPPNTDVRIEFDTDSNYLYKSLVGNENATYVLTIKELFLRFNSIIADVQIPDNYVVKILTINSFKTGITTASHYQQVHCKDGVVRVGVVFQSTAATTSTLSEKYYNSPHFTWVTDEFGGDTQLYNLYFKAGSQVIPSERVDMQTYGGKLAYHDFISENQLQLDDSPETFEDWKNQGPIYCYRVVKSLADKVENLELNVNFKATPAAYSILFSINEQIINLAYRSKVPDGTMATVN